MLLSRLRSHSRAEKSQKHLERLPVKSYKVAPGTPVGGMVFIMDKPIGIEEGMVGISMDSRPYKDFIRMVLQISLLDDQTTEATLTGEINQQIIERFGKLFNEAEFKAKIQEEFDIDPPDLRNLIQHLKANPGDIDKLIPLVMNDSKVVKKKGEYQEKGLSGLVFRAYQNNLNIDPREKFYKQIGKLTHAGNDVYMVKQDGPMIMGGSGPTIKNIKKTTTYKKNRKKWHGAISANLIAYAQRMYYIFSNRPKAVNEDAIVETLSTKIAGERGMHAQEIDIIEGQYKTSDPKFCTVVTWAQGCNDLTGHLSGGNKFFAGNVAVSVDTSVDVKYDSDGNLLYRLDQDGEYVFKKVLSDGTIQDASDAEYDDAIHCPRKIDDQNSIIQAKLDDENNLIFEKILADGTKVDSNRQEFDAGLMVSDHNIYGLGESLITMIALGDRDGIGKKGQNKAIIPILDVDGEPTGLYDFYGIDYGKAFAGPNKLVTSLQDNFYVDTFDEGDPNSCFSNYAMLYDNPLTDKMKGVYLLGAMRGSLSMEDIERIATDYERMGDDDFADKLRSHSDKEVNVDLKLISDKINEYEERLADAKRRKNKKEQTHFKSYIEKLKNISEIATETDGKILSVFEKRIQLPPTAIQLLDNMEKMTAVNAHTNSPDNSVRLNHIRVENKDRTPWQLKDNGDGSYNLYLDTDDVEKKRHVLQSLRENSDLIRGLPPIDEANISFNNVSYDQIRALSDNLTEEAVANARGIAYRTETQKETFNQNLGFAINKKEAVDPNQGLERLHSPLTHRRTATTVAREFSLSSEFSAELSGELDLELMFESRRNLSVQKAEQTESPRKNPPKLTARTRTRMTPSFDDSVHPAHMSQVAQQEHLSLGELKAYLSSNENREKLGIKSVKSKRISRFQPTAGLEIEFESKTQENQTFKAYAEEIRPATEEEAPIVAYSMDNDTKEDLKEESVERICQLAVESSKPGSTFNLQGTPEEQKDRVYNALNHFIQQSIESGRYTEENKPKILGYRPSEDVSLTIRSSQSH